MRFAVAGWIVLGLSACSAGPVANVLPPPQVALAAPDAKAHAEPAAYSRPNALTPFFEALEGLESKTADHVTILQIGDSHTAGDYFSGELRRLFQERFGNAGRGMLQAGLPFVGVRQKEVSISQTGSWKISNSLTAPNAARYDIDGFVSTSNSARATMTLEAVDPGFFDRVRVDFLRRPGGGPIEIRIDGERRSVVSTAGPLDEAGHVSLTAPGAHQLQVVAVASGTRLLSWSTERFAPGVLLDSFGVVSATVGLIDQWDPSLVRENLINLKPALIIVAYGTNEGFENRFDATAYEEQFEKTLRHLHNDAPKASILVVGPPEAARADQRCLKSGDAANCHWEVPPAIYAVREIQKRVAADTGAAFWDWSQVMVQDGGVDAWYHADPALLRPDHIHQTVAGYQRSAAALFAYLMHRYEAFRQTDASGGRPS